METREALPYLPYPLPTPSALGPSGEITGSTQDLGGGGMGLSGPHLPHKGQVPGEGAFIQGVIFREEDPGALGTEAGVGAREGPGDWEWRGTAGRQEVGINPGGRTVLSPVTPPSTVLRWVPALGPLSAEHQPHRPHSCVPLNNCLGLGSSSLLGALPSPLMAQEVLGFSSANPTPLSLTLSDSGAE